MLLIIVAFIFTYYLLLVLDFIERNKTFRRTKQILET